ncbi:MAG: YfbK domain-containing protein [Luteolibacter sp.]
MSDHLHTQPDEHLEARITAYVLGEASPFESAELEDLISKSPELQLFLNRTRTLHGLIKEAETTSNTPAEDWKLPAEKREKLDALLGTEESIVRLNKESRIRRASYRAVFGIAAVFVVTLFTIRLVPWDYEAEAVIEIVPRGRTIDPLTGQNSSQMTANFFGTEFEKIKSRNTLGLVIDELDLTNRWGIDRDSALNRLKKSVETENIRGTDLLSIRVSERDEQDALEITDSLVRNYKEYRSSLEEKNLEKGIAELKKAVREQEDKVEERRKVLTTISRTKDIVYAGDGTRRGLGVDRAANSSLDEFTRIENEKMQLESQIQSLLSYDSEQLKIYASGLDLPDNAVKTLYPEYLAKKREVEGLKANGLGGNHPTIVAQEKLLEQTKEQIDESVVNLRTRLQGQLDLAKDRLVKAEAKKDVAKREAVEENIDNSDYLDAKRDFETEQGLLERMKIKLISAEIDGDITEESIVVHDPASIKRRSALSLLSAPEKKEAPNESIALAENSPPQSEIASPKPTRLSASKAEPQIHIGGQVRTTGPFDFKEGTTLGDAVAIAGGATEFGSRKRVKVYRDGKATTYNLTDDSFANLELQAGDTIEVPQKNFFGCGAGRDELVESAPIPAEPEAELAELTEGLRSGDAAIDLNHIDAILNNPNRTAVEDSDETVMSLTGTLSPEVKGKKKPSGVAGSDFDAFAPEPTNAPAVPKPSPPASAPVAGGAMVEVDESTKDPAIFGRTSSGGVDDFGDGYGGKAGETWDSSNLDAWGESPNADGESITAGSGRDISLGFSMDDLAAVEEQRKPGNSDKGRELLEEADSNGRTENELRYLYDPIRNNPALTEESSRGVEELRRKLYMADENYDLGRYDDAVEAYEEALRIDPYNKAARLGMEKVNNAKSDYYRAAYDQTRSELLAQVDRSWELATPAEITKAPMDGGTRKHLFDEVDAAWGLAAPGETNAAIDGLVSESKEKALGSGQKAKGYEWSFDPFAETGDSAGALYALPPIIDTEGEPEVVEFEGFMNYGNGIVTPLETTSFFDSSLAEGKPEGVEYRFAWLGVADDSAKNPPQFEVGREFIYPTEFQLPELANNVNGATTFPVTPATPAGFETLDVGGELEVEGRIPTLDEIPVLSRLFKAPEISLADLSEEIPATEEPFSTFSLNISDASFQIARAAIEKGEQPDPAAIKPEQFYNAVEYGDPAPSSLEPVAAAIDQTAHPVIPGRNLVRVALRTASTGRSAAQPLRLTLLVDQSGSMVREDRRAAMETALEQLATLLTENDEVTVIGFSRTPRLLADSLPGNQAEKLPELINQTANEGGTNLEQAITLASELALRHKLDSAQNRIVLFTDGAANLGNADPTRLSESIESLRQQSISFDIAGIGATDLNDNLLAELARHGNGRYYLVDENTGASLASQLAGAFRPAAENVKVQVVLNPNRVGNYKLIGFEKDRLKTEDFRNDSVDAAELAADEAGVAMYQVETLPEGTGEIGEVSVRFRDTASGEMVERTWTIPYDPSAPAIDKADEKTQLATLSLLAAQKLQGGPLADAINLRNFSETLARLKQTYAKDEKTTQMLTFIARLK